MTGTRCAVYGCNNTYKTKLPDDQKIILHTFPKLKNIVSETMRREWIRRCMRKDQFNPDTSRICSMHFVANDYERDLQNELLGK